MTSDISWQPCADAEIIKKRAWLLEQVRDFMKSRNITEVDTPVLSHFAISDPYIQSLSTTHASERDVVLYLHTSPEFCMKRLLASGLGSIYQIAHVFRNEESGKRHNTEFTMLEWYRVEFGYYQLMDEIGQLLIKIGLEVPVKITYAESFRQTVNLDPHMVDTAALQTLCKQAGWDAEDADRHSLLDFVFSEIVMANFKSSKPLIVYDYPECMSALSTLKNSEPVVSERFELFINGMEIANGFNELTDVDEQLKRFQADIQTRRNKGLAEPPIDEHFLAALESGLPVCAGVAVGIDRLLMVLSGKDDINEVTTFSLENN
jgi:lysyl-tRNA synthetase class 2